MGVQLSALDLCGLRAVAETRAETETENTMSQSQSHALHCSAAHYNCKARAPRRAACVLQRVAQRRRSVQPCEPNDVRACAMCVLRLHACAQAGGRAFAACRPLNVVGFIIAVPNERARVRWCDLNAI